MDKTSAVSHAAIARRNSAKICRVVDEVKMKDKKTNTKDKHRNITSIQIRIRIGFFIVDIPIKARNNPVNGPKRPPNR